jgi:hypothetical protein
MIEVESRLAEELPVAADRIWALVADFGGLADWWPPGLLDRVEVEGDGVGMVRHIHTVVGIVLSEQLDALDHRARRLELSITGDLPAGMSDYHAVGQVHEVSPSSCRIEWAGRYRVPAAEVETGARAFIEGAYATMFRGLREHVTAGTGD